MDTVIDRPTLHRLDGPFGVEVRGVAVGDCSDDVFAFVDDAFQHHGALVIRGQQLDPGQLHRFAARFGPLEAHTLQQYTLPGDPFIYVLSNIEVDGRPIGVHNEGIGWHTDLTYKRRPPMSTILYGLVCPPEGSDTLVADTCAAYEALPAADKAALDGVKVLHSFQMLHDSRVGRAPLTPEQKAATPDVWHPLVRRHPRDGRKALYLGTGTVKAVEGMTQEEARRLVFRLVDFATQERFVYRHKWQAGDVLMWDNRCTLHTGTLFDDVRYKRHIHRLMMQGTEPV
ncbi:MAG: TauD/TfdA family dioxygenase [Alphaproteobacteria bacterium]|nr:TauD/TfdA family dioxygenase [Alphaproteobacteria bacterium]